MTLKQLAAEVMPEICNSHHTWLAVWKEGRAWKYHLFYGLYQSDNERFHFEEDEYSEDGYEHFRRPGKQAFQMYSISLSHKAFIINPYYADLGFDPREPKKNDYIRLAEAIQSICKSCNPYHKLYSFYQNMLEKLVV